MNRSRLLSTLVAAPAAVAAANIAPAATWLPPVRAALSPKLDGRGRADHIALTFDDGPDTRSTPAFLRELDRLEVRATFFLQGAAVLRHPALVRSMVAEGHEPAVHCWEHQPPWLPRPVADRRDLERALAAVRETAGTEPLWYRPPYGVLTATRWWAARRLGLRPVLWTAWGRDWQAGAGPDSVVTALRARLSGGATVLLHDSDRNSAPGSWQVTLAALPRLVALCRAASWRIGPLAEHGPTAGTAGSAEVERSPLTD
ncbi:polysaccharide deacetylase family protein [Streptomyces sp. WMMB303]|uniref:polysaccharide deacetylase family protein n=1 Tax=Streptomyces sp. WMMB303 TaxID=3034154 RepID=UPI0023EC7E42|nr:polysaccharide deacetylase family protein [Streptomyces sp. WMMB303]MDF4252197.1 polysaccharide deacetylase family protein [Streptomyces sp. WMMB303]